MGKIIRGKFKVDSYYFTIYVELVKDMTGVDARYEHLRKKYKFPEDHTPSLGFVLQHKLIAHLVLSEPDLCYDLIAHECSHLTFKILNFNGISTGDDNEHFALLNGYINSNVYNIILNKGCKIQTIYPKTLQVKQP